MNPYYADDALTFYQGNALDVLRQLPAESVHCVVTSPPYWALRDYGVEGQLGLEATPQEYVANLVAVFEEVRRVLRSDGTAWLNIGDSYNSGPAGTNPGGFQGAAMRRNQKYDESQTRRRVKGVALDSLKPKDLCMIPARVAIALQDAGWWLRSEITWCKKSPMPESVTDRPTSATEKVYLLTKSARYFYDAEAVKQPNSPNTHGGLEPNQHKQWAIGQAGGKPNSKTTLGTSHDGRNLWNYWLLSPHNYPEAHFATFPPDLPRTCILAGTSERGVCPACGAPWRRVVERQGNPAGINGGEHREVNRNGALGKRQRDYETERNGFAAQTTGWQPTCDCDAGDPVPATVCDPFLGSGTTAMVAQQLGRRAIGIDLKADYLDMAIRRTAQKTLWFNALEAAG